MASKYYNPTLASKVGSAKEPGFVDYGEAFSKGFERVQDRVSPYVIGAIKEYEEDIKKIYDITFDQNGISAHNLADLKAKVKQEQQAAFEARQKGIFPGKEALGDAMLNVKGAANVAKFQGAVAQEIQDMLSDPDALSTANNPTTALNLKAIAEAKIDYNDPSGNFYIIKNPETGKNEKISAEGIKNKMSELMITPDQAYLELYDESQKLVKEKIDETGQKYYAFDDLNEAQMKTIVFDKIDKYGDSFVYDAMSNRNAYRGVTVQSLIKDDLAQKIADKYGQEFTDPVTGELKRKGYVNPNIQLDLQGKTKNEISDLIAKKFNINPNDKYKIHQVAKELVADSYTQALKDQYPTRGPEFKPKEKPPGAPSNERYVAQVSDRIKKAMKNEQGTMNESTFIKIANETLSPSAKRAGKLFTDRNEGKVLYVQNALIAQKELDLKPSEKKSKADFQKEFDELYPVGAGNIFLNGNLLDIDLADPRAIGEEILGQSGVSDFEKFISNYLPPLRVPEIKRAAVQKSALP